MKVAKDSGLIRKADILHGFNACSSPNVLIVTQAIITPEQLRVALPPARRRRRCRLPLPSSVY